MITAESRDLSVATYSVESLTGEFCATCILTGMAGEASVFGSGAVDRLQEHNEQMQMNAIGNKWAVLSRVLNDTE
jgi:hypothetical protein